MSFPSFLNVAPPFTAVGRTITVRLLLPSMQCTGLLMVTFISLPILKKQKQLCKVLCINNVLKRKATVTVILLIFMDINFHGISENYSFKDMYICGQ